MQVQPAAGERVGRQADAAVGGGLRGRVAAAAGRRRRLAGGVARRLRRPALRPLRFGVAGRLDLLGRLGRPAAAAAGVGVARRRLDDAADAARPAERRPVRRCRIQPVVRPHQRGRLI